MMERATTRLVRSATRLLSIERDEIAAAAWAFAWFFLVLFAYYVLRPVRDTMAITSGRETIKWLFLATFVTMLPAVPLYALLVARLPRRTLVPVLYHFLSLNLFGFWLMMRFGTPSMAPWTARAFYVWVGVFGLYSVSILWSFLADVFSSERGGRLFGLVAGGGTLGALCGSVVTGQFVELLGVANLLLIPAVLLELALLCVRLLDRSSRHFGAPDPSDTGDGPRATGGGIMAGVTSVLRSRYLFRISAYLFLGTFCGSIMYCQQVEIVRTAISDDEGRTRLFANMNVVIQILSFCVQTLVTARFIRGLGLPATLCVLPLLCLAAFAGLSAAPILAVLVTVQVARQAVVYAIAEPARIVLFTVVTREEKYKTKSFVDTVVFRGGETVGGQVFGGLSSLGLSLAAIAWTMLPIAILWAALGWVLGRQGLCYARRR